MPKLVKTAFCIINSQTVEVEMKRIISVICATAMNFAFGNTVLPLNPDTSTVSEYRSVLMSMLSEADHSKIKQIATASHFWQVEKNPKLDSFRIEADTALAAKGFATLWNKYTSWPKVSANHRKQVNADMHYPKCIALAKKYECNINIQVFAQNGATIDELIECLNEYISFPKGCQMNSKSLDEAKKGIQKSAVLGIKRALRNQGKSFVVVNGINPCEQYMNRLNSILNAPRFKGLNDWLKELGFTSRIDESRFPSKELVEKLKDKIFYGEIKASPYHKAILSACLGVDGYNEFVKKYNGE